ncbi:hypothetical protein GIS00_05415 [Nakamurella sp. YIM 132087]|uniref:META domain-containing protein n=1 Tax=Nakamurella alba TaxID=2665158 RepID=A0A7K1FGY5_9ACTN|nr:lipocalin family protein [Nakamurella alba]MTD13385.1 hypothetical protein [Nakamurella alba]
MTDPEDHGLTDEEASEVRGVLLLRAESAAPSVTRALAEAVQRGPAWSPRRVLPVVAAVAVALLVIAVVVVVRQPGDRGATGPAQAELFGQWNVTELTVEGYGSVTEPGAPLGRIEFSQDQLALTGMCVRDSGTWTLDGSNLRYSNHSKLPEDCPTSTAPTPWRQFADEFANSEAQLELKDPDSLTLVLPSAGMSLLAVRADVSPTEDRMAGTWSITEMTVDGQVTDGPSDLLGNLVFSAGVRLMMPTMTIFVSCPPASTTWQLDGTRLLHGRLDYSKQHCIALTEPGQEFVTQFDLAAAEVSMPDANTLVLTLVKEGPESSLRAVRAADLSPSPVPNDLSESMPPLLPQSSAPTASSGG